MPRKFISILILVVSWFTAATPLLSKKITELLEVFKPGSIHILGKNMYIADGFSIQVYSLPDMKLVKKFLDKGEGPGQVKFHPSISIVNDKIVVNSAYKLLIFSPMGDLLSEKNIKYENTYISPVGNHFIGSEIILDFRKFNHVQYINLYDKDFKAISQLFKGSIGELVPFYSGDPSMKQKMEMVRDTVMPFVYKDKIFIADTSKGFFFSVFDSSGKKLYDIDVPYEKHKVTESYKKKALEDFKDAPGQFEFIFKDYFPAFKHVRFADDKVYLSSYPWRDDRCDITIIDLKGKIIKKAAASIHETSLFTVDKDCLYYLVENADEEWELHMEQL